MRLVTCSMGLACAERRRHGGAVDDAYRQATSGWSSVSPSIQQEAEKIRKREMALLMVQVKGRGAHGEAHGCQHSRP